MKTIPSSPSPSNPPVPPFSQPQASPGRQPKHAAHKVAWGTALRIINIGATALVSIVMMPFIVRMLGDRMYGLWILVATFVGYYGLADLGLSSAVNRFMARAARGWAANLAAKMS